MSGVPSFRYHGGRIPSGLYKHKSTDTYFASPLPKARSQRSPSPVESSLTHGFSPVLSKTTSTRSTTPIMFSQSNGRMMKPPPVQRNLECTLEELCYGCTKKIKVTRDVLTNTGQLIQEEEILTIKVKPGWKKGTKITFEGMGNERPGTSPADITFVIAEKKHQLYRREEDDLEMGVAIPLVKALTGMEISIPLLDGQTMSLSLHDDIIYHGYEKIIPGQGMPNGKDNGKRGNLKVVFLVNFPTKLTDDQRRDIIKILDE